MGIMTVQAALTLQDNAVFRACSGAGGNRIMAFETKAVQWHDEEFFSIRSMRIVALNAFAVHLKGRMNGFALIFRVMAQVAGRGGPVGFHAAGSAMLKMLRRGFMTGLAISFLARIMYIFSTLLVIMAIQTRHRKICRSGSAGSEPAGSSQDKSQNKTEQQPLYFLGQIHFKTPLLIFRF